MRIKQYSELNLITAFLLALLPITVIFLGHKTIPYYLVTILIFFLFEKQHKKESFVRNKKYLMPYFIMVLAYIVYSFLSTDLTIASKVLERQISLLLLPLIIFLCKSNEKWYKYLFSTFLLAMLAISIFSVIVLVQFMYEQADWIEKMISEGYKDYIQFKFPHLLGVHPTYWSYLLCICNIILLNNKSLHVGLKKPIVIGLSIVFNLNLLYLTARTPMVINFIIYTMFCINYLGNKRLRKNQIISVLGLLFFFIAVSVNLPLLKSKIANIPLDERVYLWPEAFSRISENHFVLGEGLGQTKVQMKEYIVETGDPRIHFRKYDLHNQYLTHYFDMGILGFLSLIYMISFPFIQIKFRLNNNSLALIQFSVLAMLSLLTETHLYIIKGIIIYSVFSAVFLKSFNSQKEKNLSRQFENL